MKDFEKEIAEHERAITELKDEQAAFNEMDPDQRLASVLHDSFCRWNHTDGCGWFYEVQKGVDNWNGAAHQSWLLSTKALKKRLNGYDDKTIIEIVRAVRDLG